MSREDQSGAAAKPDFGEAADEVQRLLDQGRAAEALPLAIALTAARRRAAWPWSLVARCHAALGDADAELEACERELALDPARGRARLRAAGLRIERGDIGAAAAHYQILSDAQPERAKLALRLARLNAELGRAGPEAAAWSRVLQAEPENAHAHHRLAELHWQAGRAAEAAPHLRRVARANPDNAKFWRRLAVGLEEAGDPEGAEAAWRHVLELSPGALEPAERVARIGARTRGGAAGRRLTVLGNCQAYGMASCLRALNPELEVEAVGWAELRSAGHVASVAAALENVDMVLAQPINDPALESLGNKALVRRSMRSAFFPAIHFTGFHPDALLIAGPRRPAALIGDWHSALMVAAFRMGLPPRRASELFNAYVYGVLGYFDEYAKAAEYLSWQFGQVGWRLDGELEAWAADGPFVHTPNHPRIEVIMVAARRACAQLEIETDPAVRTPPDIYAQFGDWPVYPEIGKRLGLGTGPGFVALNEGGRALGLDEAVAWCYRAYAEAPPEVLASPRVEQIIRTLKAEGV